MLGETVLASTAAVQRGLAGGAGALPLLGLAVCGLVIVFGMWWVYFGQRAERFLHSNRQGFRWGYGHFLIFSAAAAVGAGIGVAVDRTSHVGHTSQAVAGAAVAVPVAVFLLCVWLLHVRPQRLAPAANLPYPVAAALILLSVLTPLALLLTAVLVAALVATCVIVDAWADEHDPTLR